MFYLNIFRELSEINIARKNLETSLRQVIGSETRYIDQFSRFLM